ncbi:class I SAM-dependent methyltransferase [Candidatus Saccharibacteria bacterium]|nr:class I SAM-dependent methyltransferase [Candidatus Saccharibacteria bacterium]
MINYTTQKIGKVTLLTPNILPEGQYSDKQAEDDLLDVFMSSNPMSRRHEILANYPSWPMYYHLTPMRANLLGWYNFPKNSKVLEIGAGPGGVTESLVNKDIQLTALELSPKRALINAHRNKQHSNLKVVVGNLEDYKPKEKFNYIIVVGVLEYAGTFIKGGTPYDDFVGIISKLLHPNGKLLLAIENRLGLKYWTGAKEDHIHTLFEGHNDYPSTSKMKTFGRKELSDLIRANGFVSTYFYYPFPDYKSPHFIYSDDYYPGKGASFPLKSLPTKTLDRARYNFMSEQLLMRQLESNDLFRDFSNSFLIEASK